MTDHPFWSKVWGPLVGPLVSVLSFVCSIGNVPLAAVLWNGGISFGGVVSFVFADLIILPILVIYRKYYGVEMMLFMLGTFYVAMVAAGYLVELVFAVLHLTPDRAQRDGARARASAGTTRRTSIWCSCCSRRSWCGGSSAPAAARC